MKKRIKKSVKRKKNVNKNTKKIYIGGDPRSESISLGKASDVMGNIVGSENRIVTAISYLNYYLLNENPDDTEIKELIYLLEIADVNINKVYNDLEDIMNQ